MLCCGLRRAMFYLSLSRNRPLKVPEAYRRVHLLWMVLQIRQAQRFALEVLFSWVETQVLAGASRGETLVDIAVADLRKAGTFISPTRSVVDSTQRFFEGIDNLNSLLAKGLADSNYCLFSQLEILADEFQNDSKSVVPRALRVLLVCKKFASFLSRDAEINPLLTLGGAERISLLYWKDFIEKHGDGPPRVFLSQLFESLVISQHLSVATRRFDGGTQRLRITIEEDGLSSLTGTCWNPPITDDKLYSAISLMADCGIVKFDRIAGRVGLHN